MSRFARDDRPEPAGTDETTVVKARSPRDLLAAAAALLQFHPQDSIVALALSGTRVIAVARGDLPVVSVSREHYTALVGQIAAPLWEAGADALTLIGYGPAHTVTAFMDVAIGQVRDSGMRLLDALRVTDGRYFSYECDDPRCCPIEGVSLDLDTSVVTAHVVMAGRVIERDRSALENSIAPESGQAMRTMRRLADVAGRRVRDLVAVQGRAPVARIGAELVATAQARYEQGGRLSDDEMAELLVHLVNPHVRDAACAAEAEPWHEELWRDATRRAVPGLVAAPATLLAFTAWRLGRGAIANIAVDRALADDAGYTMAMLLRDVLAAGLAPSVLTEEPDRPGHGSDRGQDDLGRSGRTPGDVIDGDARLA